MHRRALLLPSLLLLACGAASPARDGGSDAASRDDVPEGTLGSPTCAAATPVADGTRRYAESIAVARDDTAGCLGRVRSVAYRITVPPGRSLVARVDAAQGPVVLQVVDGCDARACLAQSSTAGVARLRAVWRNDGAAAREVRVLAGTFSDWEGTFAVSFALEDAPANLTCASAEPLDDGAWRGEQPFAPEGSARSVCADRDAPAAAGMRWYRVSVPAGQLLAATVRVSPAPEGREHGAVVVVRDDCATDRCVTATRALVRSGAVVTAANEGGAARDYRVGVGVHPPLADARFSLAIALHRNVSGASCASPEDLATEVDVAGDTALHPATAPACASGVEGGPARFYRVTVPPGRFFEATATAAVPVFLRALSGCGGAACVAEAPAGQTTARLSVPNLTAAPMPLVLAVGARDADARTAFTLRATLADPDPAGRCEGAAALTGTSVAVSTARVADDGPTCGTAAEGPARWFRATVPARSAMQVYAGNVTEDPTAGPSWVRFVDRCGASGCLDVGASQARWANTEDVPREVLIAVGAQRAGARGSFRVNANVLPVAPNSRCDRATAVSVEAPALRESSSQSLATGRWCAPGERRLVRYYTVTVPAGQVLHAYATNPTSTFSYSMPELSLRDGCEAEGCLARGATPGPRGTHLWWWNTARSDRPMTLVAGWPSPYGNLYDLRVAFEGPAENGRCATAEALPRESFTPVDLTAAEGIPSPCAPTSYAPARWYRVRVDAGRTLSASLTALQLTPQPTASLELVGACDATACLAAAPASRTPSLIWTNEGADARDVWLAARSGDGGPMMGASLAVQVR